MGKTEKQKQDKTKQNDAVFVIRPQGSHLYHIINGENVEKRMMHYMKYESQDLGRFDIIVYVNYNPSERFVKSLKQAMKDEELGIWMSVSILVGSEDEINQQFQIECYNEPTVREIKISTMTGDDLNDMDMLLA